MENFGHVIWPGAPIAIQPIEKNWLNFGVKFSKKEGWLKHFQMGITNLSFSVITITQHALLWSSLWFDAICMCLATQMLTYLAKRNY